MPLDIDLKQKIIITPESELLSLDTEILRKMVETITPYTVEPRYTKPLLVKLIKQWLDYEDSWEVYPVERKQLFKSYKDLTGKYPDISVTTLSLFNQLIQIGAIA